MVDEVLVQWPNGQDTVLSNVAVNQTLTIVAESVVPCPADFNGDGEVDPVDLATLLGAWGPCAGDCSADLNDDGTVDPIDLAMLLGSWGKCPQ